MAGFLGPLVVLSFCASQALRDVYFAHLFQGVDFFAVILVAFALSTLVFGTATALGTPAQLRILRGQAVAVLAMNVTTAVAWTSYFFALKHLEPAVVNTVHSGLGPLTVIALAACGARLAKPTTMERGGLWSYAGIAVAIAALCWIVLAGRSGLPAGTAATSVAALLLVMVSGSSITISLLYSKRLHDHGASAQTVIAVRYLLLILLAGCVEAFDGGLDTIAPADLAPRAVSTTSLIALPLFVLQVGIARTGPLTAQVIRSLGPVCIFALQQIDGRLTYSTPTLLCILLYSAAAIVGNLAHGWKERTTVVAV